MAFEVDPKFRKSGSRAKSRQAKRQRRRLTVLAVSALALSGIIAAVVLIFWPGEEGQQLTGTGTPQASPDDALAMVQVDGSDRAGIIAARAPFIDLAKDPMILNFGATTDDQKQQVMGPAELPVARVGAPAPDRLTLLRDDLVVQETRLVTTIPSSREDLAYFQVQRSQGIQELSQQPAARPSSGEEANAGNLVSVDGGDSSWGALITTGGQAQEDTATYIETEIENTTSVAPLLRESARQPLFDDVIVVAQTKRSLSAIAQSAGLSEDDARRAEQAAMRLLDAPSEVVPGSVVAMRVRPDIAGTRLLQMSVYLAQNYLGTLAGVGAGRFDTGADPWFGKDLLAQTQGQIAGPVGNREIRLLDAIYSAAIRNGMSTQMVGELIVLLSQQHDLDRFAAVGDTLTVLYANTPGTDGGGAGQFLFAGIQGPSGKLDCFVALEGRDNYRCYSRRGGGLSSSGIRGGLRVPVAGTKTSDFGPRLHPILNQLRAHNGVDWAAPTGTPVHAAAAGEISVAGQGGGYGNVIYIDHAQGMQTRYAHLDGFAPGLSAGKSVQAGDLIGFVGTTGRSTGPHLHFELWENGAPVDPIASGGASLAASAAVDALVDQIIRVESAGRADAATFASSTPGA